MRACLSCVHCPENAPEDECGILDPHGEPVAQFDPQGVFYCLGYSFIEPKHDCLSCRKATAAGHCLNDWPCDGWAPVCPPEPISCADCSYCATHENCAR